MSSIVKVACIQNCATPEVEENIATCLDLTRQAAAAGAKLVALPEYFSGLRTKGVRIIPVAFRESEHPVIPAFARAARELGVTILLGSLGIEASDGRILNRSYLLDRRGGSRPATTRSIFSTSNWGKARRCRSRQPSPRARKR